MEVEYHNLESYFENKYPNYEPGDIEYISEYKSLIMEQKLNRITDWLEKNASIINFKIGSELKEILS